ncbi:MAG: coproporphyrinogen dehydrogenase HemZ [Eubacteriales bacterium]|nr:coproporphyrinogen dehydrogenase HemZ [Eubacteriales bacterium]
MILFFIPKEIYCFETDIRDIVMAFFPYEKVHFFILEKFNYFLQNKRKEKTLINIKIPTTKKSSIIVESFLNLNLYYIQIKSMKTSKNKKQNRNDLKRNLYKDFSKLTKKTLPWGTLTGIRPVNIVSETLDGKNKNQIENYLNKEYFLSKEKIELLIKISNIEKKVIKQKQCTDYKNMYSMYVGIPFCKSTCLYCSFTSYNINQYKNEVDNYLDALEKEIIYEKDNFPQNKKILSLYIGGGTPTSLCEKDFERLLNFIKKGTSHLKKHKNFEYTIEAGRPDTITKEKLQLMKEYNVNRISINPQTFNQKTLDIIGRSHKVEDIYDKFYMAKEMGFDNINMDLIIGLPGEKLEDVVYSFCEIAKLKPASLTIHSLALKRASRLNFEKKFWDKNYSALIKDPTEINKMMKCAFFLASELNLNPYYLYRQKNIAGNLENIGFSSLQKECLYNIMMMGEKHSVFGFGAGASSKIVKYENNEKQITRINGHKSVLDYIKKWQGEKK